MDSYRHSAIGRTLEPRFWVCTTLGSESHPILRDASVPHCPKVLRDLSSTGNLQSSPCAQASDSAQHLWAVSLCEISDGHWKCHMPPLVFLQTLLQLQPPLGQPHADSILETGKTDGNKETQTRRLMYMEQREKHGRPDSYCSAF